MIDPYKTLKVEGNASAAKVKTAFHVLAHKCHPDKNHGDPVSEEKFKNLLAAYKVLSDDEKRKCFDRGKTGLSRGSTPNAHSRPSPGPSHGKASGIKVNGPDINYDLKVGFNEAALGTTKHIVTWDGKSLKVNIPPGTRNGQVICLKHHGMTGFGDGESGNACVKIQVKPHNLFRRKGDDIHVEIPVFRDEVANGCKIQVDTIDGPVAVSIPKGSKTGDILCLKGKGIVRDGNNRGDQYIKLKIMKHDKEYMHPHSPLKAAHEDSETHLMEYIKRTAKPAKQTPPTIH